MEVRAITETREVRIGVEYIAMDGTVFNNEIKCIKYEQSESFVLKNKLKRLSQNYSTQCTLLEVGTPTCEIEIFDIQTEEDLENLKQYCIIVTSHNRGIVWRTEEEFENVTVGHEVILFWSYNKDRVTTYGDGSLQGYFDFIRGNYNEIIGVTEEENQEEVE